MKQRMKLVSCEIPLKGEWKLKKMLSNIFCCKKDVLFIIGPIGFYFS